METVLFRQGAYCMNRYFQGYLKSSGVRFATSAATTTFNKPGNGGLRIGVPKEIFPEEKRVSLTPTAVKTLTDKGFSLIVQAGAGASAQYLDTEYVKAGAKLIESGAKDLYAQSDVVLKVRSPLVDKEVNLLNPDSTLITMVYPAQNKELVNKLAERKITLLALDCIPRISRAQAFDVLSSMANIAGYKAVVEAASHYNKFFAGQITAAGRIPPAKVLVVGGGVAGLSAVATARGLGATVRAFDTREAVREQVESLGAEFLTIQFKEAGEGGGGYAKEMSKEFLDAEMALFAKQAKEVDIIITSALIPGKPAPKLITKSFIVEFHGLKSFISYIFYQLTPNARGTGASILYHITGKSDLPPSSRGASTAFFLLSTTHHWSFLGAEPII
ncbi:NAD P transhydrogenase subunit alpha [Taenia solium]|eukprot:TsM_000749300 transcript=TsM_000749300 gene=TsM_000749300